MSASRLLAMLPVAAVLAASPMTIAAADDGAAHDERARGEPRAAAGEDAAVREVVVKPLFDAKKRWRVGTTAKLRFRVQDRSSGKPPSLEDVFVSLRHPPDPEALLAARRVKEDVYEVSFKPRSPGEHELVVAVRGTAVGSIRRIRLGVVGVVKGLKEVDDPALEAELQARAKRKGSSR